MKLPPLSALRAFEVAARHLSFSKAAEELFVTHAAISHQIRKLEGWYKTALFERVGRGVRLTRAGLYLSVRISPVFADICDISQKVKVLGGRDTLTVGCIPSISSRWLVPNLNEFTAEHPSVEVKVMYASEFENLQDSDLDILITHGRDKSARVSTTHLFSRISKPVCSPSFLESFGPLTTVQQIAEAPLLHDNTREGWGKWIENAAVGMLESDTWPIYQDFNMLATAAIAGHGIALCPIEVFRLEIERGDLVVLSEISINKDSAYFVTSKARMSATEKAFIKWFVSMSKSIMIQNPNFSSN